MQTKQINKSIVIYYKRIVIEFGSGLGLGNIIIEPWELLLLYLLALCFLMCIR